MGAKSVDIKYYYVFLLEVKEVP